jgi:hypothetical protein
LDAVSRPQYRAYAKRNVPADADSRDGAKYPVGQPLVCFGPPISDGTQVETDVTYANITDPCSLTGLPGYDDWIWIFRVHLVSLRTFAWRAEAYSAPATSEARVVRPPQSIDGTH